MAARKDKNARDRELLAKRRTAFLAVLDKMGVRQEFERLPLGLRNRIYICRQRPATVILDPTAAGGSAAPELKRQIERILDIPLVDVMRNGQRLSYREIWVVMVALWAILGPPGNPKGLVAEVGRAILPAADDDGMFEIIERLDKEVNALLMFRAMQFSRLDQRIYGARIQSRTTTDPFGSLREVVIEAVEPCRRVFEIEGASRPAYQAGMGFPSMGIRWLELPPEVLGLGPGPRLPVYVQGHAMQRLMERMPGDRDEQKRGAMHMFLCGSLFAPKVVQRDDGGMFWIELRGFRQERLGYLLASVVEGAVLVKTYQFLTMHGSPEARRLYRRLGARRGDFEYLKLDQLATFMETDLEGDAELRRIFDECGCGHLFDLRRMWEWPQSSDTRTAAWVRGYLDLGPAERSAAA